MPNSILRSSYVLVQHKTVTVEQLLLQCIALYDTLLWVQYSRDIKNKQHYIMLKYVRACVGDRSLPFWFNDARQ